MAETAAHLIEQVFPPLPVRQWVLAVPKRGCATSGPATLLASGPEIRHFMQAVKSLTSREARAAVLDIPLRVIEARLRQGSGCAR